MLDFLVYLYFFVLFVIGLGSTIWVMIFYYKKTDAIIEELKSNGEIEIAEKIESVSSQSKLPPRPVFSRKKKLFFEAWKEFRRADFSSKSEFIIKTQRLYRYLVYAYWFTITIFMIPFILLVILFIVSVF